MSYYRHIYKTRTNTLILTVFAMACSLLAIGCDNNDKEIKTRVEEILSRTAPTPATTDLVDTSSNGVPITGTAPISSDGSLTVVQLESQLPSAFEPPEETAQVDQLGMEFLPPVLLAGTGHPVNFHNSEDVLHNVRVYNIDTQETAFNISTPIGGTYEHRFDKSGTYRVTCDIHPQMGSSVIVTSTPYATVAEKDGAFSFDSVPPGTYTAIVHAGPNRSQHSVTITASTSELKLD